jgi:RHS repeat-associated protein
VLDNENQSGSLEDFMFRRYSPAQGRWISPDPLGVGAVDPTKPQTWNRYAYVANNPLSHIDPLGLDEDECNPNTDDCSGGGGGSDPGGSDPGSDPGTPAPPSGPVSIPGFCDASCGGSGFGGGVDANGIPNNFGPGYLMQATSPLVQLGAAESRYLSIITTGYDPAFGDPCVYLNDAGTAVEPGGTDYNSNPDECKGTHGVWVPPNYTIKFDSFGNYYIQPQPILSPNTCLAWQGASTWLLGFNLGLSAASGGTASVGLIITVPNFVFSNSFCSGGGSTHW